METNKQISMAITYKGITQSAVAEALGMSKSSFNQKLKRDTWNKDELEKIAYAIGSKYVCYFEFPDGYKIA